MTALLNRLSANPADWDLRTSIVRQYYEARDFDMAAKILAQAPKIPSEESSVLFAATVFSKANPSHSLSLLDKFSSVHGTTVDIERLKARISHYHSPKNSVPPAANRERFAPVPPREDDTTPPATRNIEVVPADPDHQADLAYAPVPAREDDRPSKTPVFSEETTAKEEPLEPKAEELPSPEKKKKGLLPHSRTAPVKPSIEDNTGSAPESDADPIAESQPEDSKPDRAKEHEDPVGSEDVDHEVKSDDKTGNDSEEEKHGRPDAPELHKTQESDSGVETESGVHIFVSGGEAVHPTDKEDDRDERIKALVAAVVVHLVFLIIFAFSAVSSPPPTPPQIVASAPAEQQQEPDATTLERKAAKNTDTQAVATPTIAASAFSSFAIPDNLNIDVNVDMSAISDNNANFTNSMPGFGGMKGVPASMRSRCTATQRMSRLRENGGDEKAEDAVVKGLIFLASKQDKKTGAIGTEYTVGMTGLSLLAFLGHCETPESLKFGDTVVKATLFLMNTAMENNGRMTNGEPGDPATYEHAIATYALCELHTMTRASGREIPRLGSVIRKAVGIIVNSQHRDGGWPYGFTGEGLEDLSVSGWQIQALKAAHNTGERIPGVEQALNTAVNNYLPRIQDSQGAFKYNPGDPAGRDSLTSAALLGMKMWNGSDKSEYYRGLRYLTNRYLNPSPGGNYYTPYYNTQLFFLEGGEAWENYNIKFQPLLLAAQNPDGSWLGTGPRRDDRIMNTAWAVLMLEVYYRYLPTTDKVDLRTGR